MPSPSQSRDLRLDFFRGVSLILIFIDHIPENVLAYFTLPAVTFFDAAEVFIFISGFTTALVYGRRLAAKGALYMTAQVFRRAWQLYVAHVFLFVMFIAEVSYTVMTFNNPMYNEEMRVADFLGEPHIAVVKALLLQFQPTFLDILPLYILMLAIFPFILLGLRLRPALVLIPSFVIYAAVQIFAISVPAYPEGHVWYFNPLAWQFLFVAGAALGYRAWQGGADLPASWVRPALAVAAGATIGLTIIKLSWTIHGVWDSFPGLFLRELWPVNKNNLAPLRLIAFFAAVLLVAERVPPQARFLTARAARPLLLCGRHSLEIFCLGILLSALGHFLLTEYESGVAMQFVVNIVGVIVMFAVAKIIDWYRTMESMPLAQSSATASRAGGGGSR